MKFLSSEEAVSEVVGQVIILGITVVGVGMITLYGVPAILDLQDMANIKNAEQTLTVLDSRAGMAMLGDSPLQITNVNLGGGTIMVEPNSSNRTSYITVNSSAFNFTIPMGKVKYQLGDRIIAYEGGGVWSKYPSGSVMLSPPDFHYNGITLTLPVINISGNTSAGGKGIASVSFRKTATVVQYPNKSIANRTNPINYNTAGKVYVNITSDYYDAWADYARSLSYANVKVNSTTKTTSVEFTVIPVTLERNTSIVNPIGFRWLDPGDTTPLGNFSFRIYAIPDLNPLDWQISAQSGTKRLVIQLVESGGGINPISIRVGYQDTSFGWSEKWKKDNAFSLISDSRVDIDLLKSIDLKYEAMSVPSTGPCGLSINQSFNPNNFTWTDRVVNDGSSDTQSLFNVTQHYFQLMGPDITLNRCNEGTDPVDYTTSTMLINYTGNLSYLHITENRADVGIS